MLFRSTGLGKIELVGKFAGLQRAGDYLVLNVDVLEPVRWKIRAAMSYRDLAAVVVGCGKASILSFLLSPAQWFKRSPRHPESF
jgi:hypothetical protein